MLKICRWIINVDRIGFHLIIINKMVLFNYNNLVITSKELESCALNYAENYWYDKSNFQKPQSAIQCFYEDFGETDEDMQMYDGLLFTYFGLCEGFKSNPEIREKYIDVEE